MSQTKAESTSGEWRVIDHDRNNQQTADSRSEAEDKAQTARDFGSSNVEVLAPGETSGGSKTDDTPEVVDAEPLTKNTENPAPQPDFAGGMNIDQDPLDVLPGWMVTQVEFSDRGDSTTTVNKRGCQVIAEYLGLAVETTAEVAAHESGFEYAYYKATVTKPDGRTVTGHGTARADDNDQKADVEGWKLDMMAETRAYKRAVKNATGGGIEAFAKESGGQ